MCEDKTVAIEVAETVVFEYADTSSVVQHCPIQSFVERLPFRMPANSANCRITILEEVLLTVKN